MLESAGTLPMRALGIDLRDFNFSYSTPDYPIADSNGRRPAKRSLVKATASLSIVSQELT